MRRSIGIGGVVAQAAWALYDWANSPFTTLIITFVFPAYFAAAVVRNDVAGQAMWGYAIAASGLIIAVSSPLLGALADAGGRQKPYLLSFTIVCVVASALLWFAVPDPDYALFAMACVVVANIGFEFGVVFNNAMLPSIVDEDRLGRLSGWAWALGYTGGLAALLLALVGFVQSADPWLGLSTEDAAHIRIVGPFVALWLLAFGWPVLAFTPERHATIRPIRQAIRLGLKRLRSTLRELPTHPSVALFLLAHMIYADGLTTIFAFGGVYAAGTFGMSLAEVMQFGILLNVTAGIGAFASAWLDDLLGSRRTILLSLFGILATSAAAVLVEERASFWLAGAVLGVFVGPAQAASRSLMARLTPEERRGEFFGLFALSGKATAFAGPAVVAVTTGLLESQRAGLASALAFFVLGGALLFAVEEPAKKTTPEEDGQQC